MIKRQQYQDALTDREVQVLELVAQGRRNKDIAMLLHISLATVENHLHHMEQSVRYRSCSTEQVVRPTNTRPVKNVILDDRPENP